MAHGDITHIEIPVGDFDQAKSFYGTLFGWQIAEAEGYEGFPMWQAPNKISGGGLVERTAEFAAQRSYVEVDSIDDTLAQVTALGGTVVAAKAPISETTWWAAFTDPDGNTIGLFEGTM